LVTAELRPIAPVMPAVRVSALGTDAVVDGCLASGAELAWAAAHREPGGPACPGTFPLARAGRGRRRRRRGDLVTGELMAAEMAEQPEVLARVTARAPADTGAVRAGTAPPAGRNRVPGPRLLRQRRGVSAGTWPNCAPAGRPAWPPPSLHTRYHATVDWSGT